MFLWGIDLTKLFNLIPPTHGFIRGRPPMTPTHDFSRGRKGDPHHQKQTPKAQTLVP